MVEMRPDRPPLRALWAALFLLAAAAVVADFFIEHHGKFGIDGSIGFYAWYGMLVAIGLIVLSRLLGYFLARPEDYYDR